MEFLFEGVMEESEVGFQPLWRRNFFLYSSTSSHISSVADLFRADHTSSTSIVNGLLTCYRSQSSRTGCQISPIHTDPAANLAMKPRVHARCSLIRTLFGTLLLFAGTINALPGIAFPINSQVPSVARVSKPYQFVFSGSTFTSSLQELRYALSGAPQWLNINSSARMLYGIPGEDDAGAANFGLVATDTTGSTNMPVTLVTSSDPGPSLGKPITQQLPAFGTFSGPDSLLIYPSSPFSVSLGPDTFTNINKDTVYYASLGDNTPLPSWINFDSSALTFTGTTPSFTSPLELPQQFPIQLTASDVVGFSGAIAGFQFTITSHEVTFRNPTTVIKITPGKPVEFSLTQLNLVMDNRPLNYTDLAGITAEPPAWLSMDTHNFLFSGTPTDAVQQSFLISVTDRYGDTASTTILLSIGTSSSLIVGSIDTIEATIGSNFTYKFQDSLFSTSGLQINISLGNTSTWLRFDEATLSLYGEVPGDLEPQADQLTLTASNGSQSQSHDFAIALSRGGVSSVEPSSAIGGGSTVSTSASAAGVVSTVQPLAESAAGTQQRGKIIAGAVVGSSIGSFAVVFLLCFIRRKRQKRDREGYLGAFRRQISGPRLQKSDNWDHPEHTEKFVSSHRRVPSRVPQVDLAKRQSRLSDFFRSSPFFHNASETGRPKSRGRPDLSTMDEDTTPLQSNDAYRGVYERNYTTKRVSRGLPLSTSASAYLSRQYSTRSLTDANRSSRYLNGLGHGLSLTHTLSRSRSRQFKRSSRASTSYGFGHGKNASFDRLSSPPPVFDRAKAPRTATTTSSDDHMSAECPSPSIYSSGQLHDFPRPPDRYSTIIHEDATNFSRPTIRTVGAARRVSRTPTPTRGWNMYIKTRRSQHESAFFSAGASSRKSSVANKAKLHPGMSTHAESSSEEPPKSSSSTPGDDGSDKENRPSHDYTHARALDFDAERTSPAYRKGLMMQQRLSAASSHLLSPPLLKPYRPLPSTSTSTSKSRTKLRKRLSRSASPLKLTSATASSSTLRFQGTLGKLRSQISKSSLTSSQRLEGTSSDVGEDLMLEMGEGAGRAGLGGAGRLGDTGPAGSFREGSVGSGGMGEGRGRVGGEGEGEEEGKVWAHKQHPNPLGVHGTRGQMRGLIWSKKERVGGGADGGGSGEEGFGGGSGSEREWERERWGVGGDEGGSGSTREGEGRDFSGVGAFI